MRGGTDGSLVSGGRGESSHVPAAAAGIAASSPAAPLTTAPLAAADATAAPAAPAASSAAPLATASASASAAPLAAAAASPAAGGGRGPRRGRCGRRAKVAEHDLRHGTLTRQRHRRPCRHGSGGDEPPRLASPRRATLSPHC